MINCPGKQYKKQFFHNQRSVCVKLKLFQGLLSDIHFSSDSFHDDDDDDDDNDDDMNDDVSSTAI